MLRRYLSCHIVVLAALGLVAGSLSIRAQEDDSKLPRKFKVPPPSARIEITVLRDANGKPIENAAVVFHPMQGEKDKGAMELKTNEDGKTVIDVLPMGDTVRLQVIAKGFQTYGQDFKVDQLEMAFEIKLKRPGEQYSIYKNHPASGNSGKSAQPDKPATDKTAPSSANAATSPASPAPDTQPDKPADSSQSPPQPR
jgi:hypothetical protein